MQKLITLSETAEILGVSYGRAADLARQNVIPVVRLGRCIRVDPERLAAFIAEGGKALPGIWRKSAD